MLTVATIMQSRPETVHPEMSLTMLERKFLDSGFSGFPVVEEERLVGVISRSDVVRSLVTERCRAEQISDYYSTNRSVTPADEIKTLEAIASQLGVRLEGLSVDDVMIRNVVSIDVSEPIDRLAALMLEGHFHRLPVLEGDRLVGLVTSVDLVRLIANGRLIESHDSNSAQTLLSTRSEQHRVI